MTIQAQPLAILNDDGTYDTRYTIGYSAALGGYMPYFCNLRIAKEVGSVESALIKAKNHQTKQILWVYCG
jgi:hypothetical protein